MDYFSNKLSDWTASISIHSLAIYMHQVHSCTKYSHLLAALTRRWINVINVDSMSCVCRWTVVVIAIAHCIMRTLECLEKLMCTSLPRLYTLAKSYGHLLLLRYIFSVDMYHTFCVLIHIVVTVLSVMPLYMYCSFPLGLYSLLDLLDKLILSCPSTSAGLYGTFKNAKIFNETVPWSNGSYR